VEVNRIPPIKPDYTRITIPPNIAPLNFFIQDSSSTCVAEIKSVKGSALTAWGKKGRVLVDEKQWKRLLSMNAGNSLNITIYTQDSHGVWRRYKTFENTIAKEPIDHYCTYRLLHFQYNYWRDLRLCQRDLTSFTETELVNTLNDSQKDAFKCINCHMPLNNDPSHFVLQLRNTANGSAMLLADGDSIITLLTRFGHAAWHPAGKYIAFSKFNVHQCFHSVGKQFIDVYDKNSRIVIFDVASRKIIPVPQLNIEGVLDTWPCWSPDGKYLYFCRAPIPWEDSDREPPENFNQTQYSLLRISYDTGNNTWGDLDTVLSHTETGLSITMPRISPDNKYCLFCMQNHGVYAYIEASSDLYLMDLATRQYHKLSISSEYNESWHSWSSNSRWILFSSRRYGGIFSRLYISYIDSTGNVSKPFLLPQRDPVFYNSFIKCFNVAELATAPVRFSERDLLKAIRTKHPISVPLPDETKNGSPGDNWSAIGDRE
jgi:hypothetical protein